MQGIESIILLSSQHTFFFFFFNLFLAVLGLRCFTGFSLVAVSGNYSLAVRGLLTEVAALVAEHGL